MIVRLRSLAMLALDHLEAIAVIAVLALLLALTALDLSGHRLFVVDGASMEPAIPRGALIVVRSSVPDAIGVGDVVTFEHRGATITHRVADVDLAAGARVFTTKGDANEAADPDAVSFEGRVGLLVFSVPVLGYALALLQWVGRPASAAVGVVIALWALRRYRARPFPLAARA
ncbi:MAG: signal peptidase I [Chloroflexota bacterium]|nr:signal peptidase I [Chloroflexota bacterium]